jgi:hypothetical protein
LPLPLFPKARLIFAQDGKLHASAEEGRKTVSPDIGPALAPDVLYKVLNTATKRFVPPNKWYLEAKAVACAFELILFG